MRLSSKTFKLGLVLLGGIAALAITSPATLRASGGSYCTNDCDRAIAYLKCQAGTTCTAQTCIGESGTPWPYELSCVNEQ